MRSIIHYLRRNLSVARSMVLTIIPTIDPNTSGGRVTQVQTCQTKITDGVDVVNCTLDKLTSQASTIFFAILSGIAIILLLWAGIQYIQALGNADAVKQARQRIINIFIAVVLLVAAYVVVDLLVVVARYLTGFAS